MIKTFWDLENRGLILSRELYQRKIKPFAGQNLVKVLTGQRRVGKSYILYQLMKDLREKDPSMHVIYIDKEDMAFDLIRNAQDLDEYVKKETQNGVQNIIIIDEVQEIEHFEKALRSFILNPAFDVYCTGSNANLLSSDLASLLGGRYIEIRVFGLGYLEFLQFNRLENHQDSLLRYLRIGGMPHLHRLPQDEEIQFEYLRNLLNTILYKDIVRRFGIRNIRFLDQLIRFLASHCGSIFSANSISDFLKSQHIRMAPNQIQVYVEHLLSAFLIGRSERYDLSGKRIFEFGEKYYFEDLGLRNTLVGFKTSDINQLIENAVFNHLQMLGYQVTTGQSGKVEVDFIGEKKNEKIYIQATYLLESASTVMREFGNLLSIKDNHPKWVVSMDPQGTSSYEGIKHITLREFLSKESLEG
jgi:predicted AAA+ superfamily ATPase